LTQLISNRYLDRMTVSKEMRVSVSRNLGSLIYVPNLRAVLPERIEATATSDSWPGEALLVIVIESGKAIVDEVRLSRPPSGPAVTSEALRAVPVASIMRHAVSVAAIPARDENGQLSIEIIGPDGSAQPVAGVEKLLPRRRPRQSKSQRRQLLTKVAETYREALDRSAHPGVYVAEILGYSGSHARKLIHDARTEGLLGPAPGPGRLGESVEHKEDQP
jgi:hypothetical protein